MQKDTMSFCISLLTEERPMGLDYAKALALVAEDEWDAAHKLVQGHDDELACLIHGYLHRIEGDLDNAAYWYRHAGTTLPDNTLDEEHGRLSGRIAAP